MKLDLLFSCNQVEADQVANETGKRYTCPICGSEFIVTKGGTGTLICCNQPMQLKR